MSDFLLTAMTFPQVWDSGAKTLTANLILLPSQSPFQPLLGPGTPAFVDHIPTIRAVAISGLDGLPRTGAPSVELKIIGGLAGLASARPTYDAVLAFAKEKGVDLVENPPPSGKSPFSGLIKKAAPQSYLDVTGARTSETLTTIDDFACEIRSHKPHTKGKLTSTFSWGTIFSLALRQRLFADALRIRYQLTLEVKDIGLFSNGGWLYFQIDPVAAGGTNWFVDPKSTDRSKVRLYAARIPAIEESRCRLFAPILFPVNAIDPSDESFDTVERYDDGFAKIVHLHQPQNSSAAVGDHVLPPGHDVGIQVGWDDEQVVQWLNGQVNLQDRLSVLHDGTTQPTPVPGMHCETPLGVSGYRIDVADVTKSAKKPKWNSLVRARTNLPLGLGLFDDELVVEPSAARPPGQANAWLPLYFTHWTGGSLVVPDTLRSKMLAAARGDNATFKPEDDQVDVLLSYGRSYAFRVRLADLSCGGPDITAEPKHKTPTQVAGIDFRRLVPPRQPGYSPPVSLTPLPRKDPADKVASIVDLLTFTRPLIAYPEVLYTRLGDTKKARKDIANHFVKMADPKNRDRSLVGLPDPDVTTLDIVVEVRSPLHDVAGDGELDGPYRKLYHTTRQFQALPDGSLPDDPGLNVNVAAIDTPSIEDWNPEQSDKAKALLIPRGRDVRITFRATANPDPKYFGPAAHIGTAAHLTMRAEEMEKVSPLIVAPIDDSPAIRGFMFRRPSDINAQPVVDQMAQELGLIADGLTLTAPTGTRIAFGASKGIRHTLSGDESSITFSSETDLLRSWVVVMDANLERDWTWDGLEKGNRIDVNRNGVTVGSLFVPQSLGYAAIADPARWDRRRTRLLFFDSVDPHETTSSGFPESLSHNWSWKAELNLKGKPVGDGTLTPDFKPGTIEGGADELDKVKLELTLPITIPPSQIPEIASVGLAYAPFVKGKGYRSTTQRERCLWIELASPILNRRGDALFARVIAHGADPLLYDAEPSSFNDPLNSSTPPGPPLNLDPELMRMIVPEHSDDRAGLDAMTILEQATDSDRHFLLPIPPGMSASDPELFGFYTYELRVGHAGRPEDHRTWSTAQGRFGRPLRVAGVQHPAPPLVCRANRILYGENIKRGRLDTFIRATAPYATPTLNGKPLPRRKIPTDIYFLLYAQTVQADGAANRNVLLFQVRGKLLPEIKRNELFRTKTNRECIAYADFSEESIELALEEMGLPTSLPVNVLAVEFLPGGTSSYPEIKNEEPPRGGGPGVAVATATKKGDLDPLNLSGNPRRILRVSPLVPVGPIC